jgi:succinate-semialdehyde dehydrogenase / glutarate-semialdehyde dehydrogenase
VSFELGGNAPFIVFGDADIDAAVEGAIVSKYRNAGQTCVCANRIFLQTDIYDEFSRRFTRRVAELRVGGGFEQDSLIGPLIDGHALAKVEDHVTDAVSKGARVLLGGKRHQKGGTFYEPTVLADASANMKIFSEETFGPVSPLFRFETEEEVIALANDSEFGLASYFYSRDLGRAHRVSEALASGMVGINTGMITTVAAPFGGVNQSGIGREGGTYGLDEYLEVKYVCTSGI